MEIRAMSSLPVIENRERLAQKGAMRFGFWSAILLAILAATDFALGIATPPRSGPYCIGNCIVFPYTDAAQFVPRDYYWVLQGILLAPVFVVVVGCIQSCVQAGKRHLGLIALCFASISAAVLAIDYFIQFQVAEPSLRLGETSGLGLFTQYNPHGLFIALEDLGYLALSVAFVFTGAAFPGAGGLGRAIRWIAVAAGLLGFVSFVGMTWRFGLNLEYRFEVAIITITWTALLVLGILFAFFFRGEASKEPTAVMKTPVRPLKRF
jgi:hypothetical protein